MGGTGVIDRFLEVFTSYIDSGFGLLNGEVAFLSSTLVAIDITLAGLFWALASDEDVIARLIRKTLYVGFFAFLIGNFNTLAKVIFNSFAGLGLKAAGSGLSADQFVQPGRIAQVGIDAGKPILQAASQLMGFVSFFENFVQIVVLLIAWLVVLVAFFILAVQLFITLIEFKLTTLAGFVLVPFGLFNKTAFLAERVLGNVIASGVKVLVLAVIVGIGTTLFSQFTQGFGGNQPTLDDAMALVLAALALLGLGIFGPGIATGLAAGAPQLGAGAAVGTALAAGGLGVAGAIGMRAGVGAVAGAVRGTGSSLAGSAFGTSSVGTAGPSAGTNAPSSTAAGGAPEWAQRMRRHQAMSHGISAAAHAVRSGDHGGKPPFRSPRITNECLSASFRPLRPDTRARDTLSKGGPGVGRAHRFGAHAGQKLAPYRLRQSLPGGGTCCRPRVAVRTRHRGAVGRSNRQAR
jgi:type IV secretion system protein TrbL